MQLSLWFIFKISIFYLESIRKTKKSKTKVSFH